MNCQFSYTTKMGLKGNLSTAHVVEQLVIAARMCNQELGLGVVMNVMFMSMREPFQNLDNKITDVEIMTNGQGLQLSPLKVGISTSGVVPQIRTFCQTSDCCSCTLDDPQDDSDELSTCGMTLLKICGYISIYNGKDAHPMTRVSGITAGTSPTI
ncbi:unnamed protein product [Sphagnum jensenii]